MASDSALPEGTFAGAFGECALSYRLHLRALFKETESWPHVAKSLAL